MAVELNIAIQTSTATSLWRKGRALDVAFTEVHYRAVVGRVIRAPAGRFLCNGVCVVISTKVGAEAVGLIDTNVWNSVSMIETPLDVTDDMFQGVERNDVKINTTRTSSRVGCVEVGTRVERHLCCYQGRFGSHQQKQSLERGKPAPL